MAAGNRKRSETYTKKERTGSQSRNKHDLVQISPHWETWRQPFKVKHLQQGPLFTCRKCWKFGPYHISHDKCGKINFSQNFNKLDTASKQYLAIKWKVSLDKAEATLQPKSQRTTETLAIAKFKRLVQQGVEPHPGPSYTKRRDTPTISKYLQPIRRAA